MMISAQLDRIADLLDRIHGAVAQPFGGIATFHKVEWDVAGAYADLDLKDWYGGVLVINETADDAYVGFAPGAGTSTRYAFRLGAFGWANIPFRCSYVSVGGDLAGSAVVAPLLEAATQPQVGSF